MKVIHLLLISFLMNAEEKLSIEEAVVHRPTNITERSDLKAIAAVSLIAEKPDPSLTKLTKQAAAAKAKIAQTKLSYLLVAGPELDSPDQVKVHSLIRQNDKLVLQIWHTSARLTGAKLRRNIQWRPLVQVPVDLPPGKWHVEVHWIPYSDLRNGRPLGKPKIDEAQFEVTAPARNDGQT